MPISCCCCFCPHTEALLIPLGARQPTLCTPTPTPCSHLPHAMKTPVPHSGHPPCPAFVLASHGRPLPLLPHPAPTRILLISLGLQNPTPGFKNTPLPHWALPVLPAPTRQLMLIFARPYLGALRWREERLIPKGRWVLPDPR